MVVGTFYFAHLRGYFDHQNHVVATTETERFVTLHRSDTASIIWWAANRHHQLRLALGHYSLGRITTIFEAHEEHQHPG